MWGAGRFRLRKFLVLLNNEAFPLTKAINYFVTEGLIPKTNRAVALLFWTFQDYFRDQQRLTDFYLEHPEIYVCFLTIAANQKHIIDTSEKTQAS